MTQKHWLSKGGSTMINVAINGYGRIGRNVLRAFYERPELKDRMRLVAINDLGSAEMNAHLTQFDTTHGRFAETVVVEGQDMLVGTDRIRILAERDPSQLPWGDLAVDIVFECTGLFTEREAARQHLVAGAKRVLVSAPGKGMDATVVYGINHASLTAADVIVSNASCTTNCLAPLAKPLYEAVGIDQGLMTTIHAYTNDQNLIDNYHKGSRRGRSAALNMVLTETGAAKAVVKAVPELEGKLTGNAIRVPIPNVSMAILNLTLDNATTKEELNEFLRDIALHSKLQNQISYTESPDAVSSDFVGTREAGVVDSNATIVSGNNVVLYLWYDNEFGYCCQVGRMVYKMAGVKYQYYPVEE